MEWFGFWIFMTVWVSWDCWLYNKGHDTFFQTHKTDAEKAIQRRQTTEKGSGG